MTNLKILFSNISLESGSKLIPLQNFLNSSGSNLPNLYNLTPLPYEINLLDISIITNLLNVPNIPSFIRTYLMALLSKNFININGESSEEMNTDSNILIDIKNYLNAVIINDNSMLYALKIYLNSLGLNRLPDTVQKTLYQSDFVIINILKNYLTADPSTDTSKNVLLSYLNGLLNNKPINIRTATIDTYLKNKNMTGTYINNIKTYLNGLHLPKESILINLRDYLPSSSPVDTSLFDSSILININSYLNLGTVNTVSQLNTSFGKSRDKLMLINIKNYINNLKIPSSSSILMLQTTLNSLTLPNIADQPNKFPNDQTQKVDIFSNKFWKDLFGGRMYNDNGYKTIAFV